MKSKPFGLFRINKAHLYSLLLLWLGVHIFLFYIFGIRDYFVDSLRYIDMADYLLSHRSLEASYQVFYLIPISVLAIFRLVFGNGVLAFVLFQSMVSALAAIALYKSAATLYGNATARLCASFISLLWKDCIQWNTALMTESLAASLICMVIYCITHFRESLKSYIVLFLLILLCTLTRPTGVLIAFGTVVFLLTRYSPALAGRPCLRFFLLFSFGVIACSGAYLMLNEWDFTDQYERGNIVTYMDTIEGQPHYYDALRLNTSALTLPDSGRPFEKIVFFAYHNPLHFVHAGALKVVYLVSGMRPYFSHLHNVYTVVWLMLVYALFYWGFRRTNHKAVRSFCLTVVIANCFLVSVSAVDWDNRFFCRCNPALFSSPAAVGTSPVSSEPFKGVTPPIGWPFAFFLRA
jgi:4-amino-4-deoxy-L-arabinose transferase-like glycosyltransferase